MNYRTQISLAILLNMIAPAAAAAGDGLNPVGVQFYQDDPSDQTKKIWGNTPQIDRARGEKAVGVYAAITFKNGKKGLTNTSFKLDYMFYDINGRLLNQHSKLCRMYADWDTGVFSSDVQLLPVGAYFVRVYRGSQKVGQGDFYVTQRPDTLKSITANSHGFQDLSLTFWESSHQKKAVATNTYTKVFERDHIASISAALSLITPKARRARIAFRFVSDRGRILYEPRHPNDARIDRSDFPAGSTSIRTHEVEPIPPYPIREMTPQGIRDYWQPGRYFVEIYIDAEKAHEESFLVAQAFDAMVDRSNDAARLARQAQQLIDQNSPADLDQAIALLTEAIALTDDGGRYYAIRAWAHVRQQQNEPAIDDFQRAISAGLRDPEVFRLLAQLQAARKTAVGYYTAMKTLDSAIAAFPQMADLRVTRGICRIKLGDFKKAVEEPASMLRWC